MKIAIIGNAGSGKSTLAFQLNALLNIPIYHLDQYFWLPNWQRPCREEFAKVHHELCNKPTWIIEGMAAKLVEYRMQQADVIIFLDTPLRTCLYRVFKRSFAGYGTVRNSSAAGCPERLPDLEFLTYIWNFNRKQKPYIKMLLKQYQNHKKIFIIKNKRDILNLISLLTSHESSL